MNIYLCVEDKFRDTPWCSEIISGLYSEIKRRRLEITEIETEKIPVPNTDREVVILVGSLRSWIYEKLNLFSQSGYIPIVVSNTYNEELNTNYNSVASDIYSIIERSVQMSKAAQKNRIALYGINPDSSSDIRRCSAFYALGGEKRSVFYNYGSLKGLFYSFYPSIENYDTVICANDFAAVSLVDRLKKLNYDISRLYIISCLRGALTDLTSPSITSFQSIFSKFGKASLEIADMAVQNPNFAVTVHIRPELFVGGTTPGISDENKPLHLTFSENDSINIYNDPEVNELICVENLLRGCDATDLEIIKAFAIGFTYEQVAENSFISVSSVKYRVRKMCRLFGVESLRQLLSAISRYF